MRNTVSASGGYRTALVGMPFLQALSTQRRRWLVTGSAGFIASHLVETLLRSGQEVVSLDNFSTGHQRNLDEVKAAVGDAWRAHTFIEADIRDFDACRRACDGVDYVLHHAALGSVPRSIADPIEANESNVTGFVNMLVASRDAKVRRFVYAASSSTYGDHPGLPKVEDEIGRPLSPYAVTKYVNELYADVFARCYGMQTIGLRYFNVFGARQDPNGPYAAVIPRWVQALLTAHAVEIFGDGETSRDFCYVGNVVQMNVLAATSTSSDAVNQIYNVAVGGRTTLNQLFETLRDLLATHAPEIAEAKPVYKDFRAGDVRHSQADISKAQRLLGFAPTHDLRKGLREALGWYIDEYGTSELLSAPAR